MNIESNNNPMYVITKSTRAGRCAFLDMADESAVEALRNGTGNRDIFISSYYLTEQQESAPRIYLLYFHLASQSLETTRTSALQAYQYISERFKVPDDGIEVVYTQDGGLNPDKRHDALGGEMTILVQPVVFDSQPTPLMPALNYHLSRQIAKEGIKDINIDVYERDHFVRLPNSVNSATSRFVIPLSLKELLYLDDNGINELAKQPKPEDSEASPYRATEAVEWFAATLADLEKQQRQQDQLRRIVLDAGWEVPPCIRHLMRLCLYDSNRLEAYRTISQFLSWIKAGPAEIRHMIGVIDRRNSLQDLHRRNAIITYAVENPWFVRCRHRLLQQFCPADGCFMTDLAKKCGQPYLFEKL